MEQLWPPLHFVNYDILPAGVSRGQFAHAPGTGGIEALLGRGVKINSGNIRKGAVKPCALSCSVQSE